MAVRWLQLSTLANSSIIRLYGSVGTQNKDVSADRGFGWDTERNRENLTPQRFFKTLMNERSHRLVSRQQAAPHPRVVLQGHKTMRGECGALAHVFHGCAATLAASKAEDANSSVSSDLSLVRLSESDNDDLAGDVRRTGRFAPNARIVRPGSVGEIGASCSRQPGGIQSRSSGEYFEREAVKIVGRGAPRYYHRPQSV